MSEYIHACRVDEIRDPESDALNFDGNPVFYLDDTELEARRHVADARGTHRGRYVQLHSSYGDPSYSDVVRVVDRRTKMETELEALGARLRRVEEALAAKTPQQPQRAALTAQQAQQAADTLVDVIVALEAVCGRLLAVAKREDGQ